MGENGIKLKLEPEIDSKKAVKELEKIEEKVILLQAELGKLRGVAEDTTKWIGLSNDSKVYSTDLWGWNNLVPRVNGTVQTPNKDSVIDTWGQANQNDLLAGNERFIEFTEEEKRNLEEFVDVIAGIGQQAYEGWVTAGGHPLGAIGGALLGVLTTAVMQGPPSAGMKLEKEGEEIDLFGTSIPRGAIEYGTASREYDDEPWGWNNLIQRTPLEKWTGSGDYDNDTFGYAPQLDLIEQMNYQNPLSWLGVVNNSSSLGYEYNLIDIESSISDQFETIQDGFDTLGEQSEETSGQMEKDWKACASKFGDGFENSFGLVQTGFTNSGGYATTFANTGISAARDMLASMIGTTDGSMAAAYQAYGIEMPGYMLNFASEHDSIMTGLGTTTTAAYKGMIGSAGGFFDQVTYGTNTVLKKLLTGEIGKQNQMITDVKKAADGYMAIAA